jgi:glucose/arabinose dehydrogenase
MGSAGLLTALFLMAGSAFGAMPLTTTRVASGLSMPLYVTSPPGDIQRLFIVEQVSAQLKILQSGQVLATPFLDLNALVINNGGEQGLLGLAFHPNYAVNGYFYVNYTANSGNSVTARYQVSADPNIANPASAQILLDIPDPYSNHNGGCLAFGPDGYLYLGLGDGGSGNDPQNRAQNGLVMWGKMLRLDVNTGNPYGIPTSNPFVGNPNMLPEIWAIGLRNPWRWSFDRLTGHMYIGDVGQNAWEEIDYQPAGVGGQNWGWRVWEGNHSTGLGGLSTIVPTVTFPIYEYAHSGSASVTGGYVYRGSAIPDLQGTYFFAEFVTNQIWSFRYDGFNLTNFQTRTTELAPSGGLSLANISSFGEDAQGELYLCDLYGGEVFKIIPALDLNMIPVSPPIIIPASGGAFSFNVQIQNRSSYSITFDGWIMQYTPQGQWQGPMLGPVNLTVPGGVSLTRLRQQNVPSTAPAGIYTYRGYLGLYTSNTQWDSSSFTYTKSNLDISCGEWGDWDNTGETFAPFENPSTADQIIPAMTGLVQISPNPFNPNTTINYKLQAGSLVSLKVYDTTGRLAATLVDNWREAGSYQTLFDGANLPSGVYFAQLQTADHTAVAKMMLLK